MKVGGNESATKFFQQNGGSAALNSKDPKTKYTSQAATKYKDELKKRAARDAQEYVTPSPHDRQSAPILTTVIRYPGEVIITDGEVGSSTPAGEPDDDFFSSWDKPAIKKPTPPISRTATPPVVGRTSSPFLNSSANGKDIARTSSPLARADGHDSKPAASRLTSSAALRKTTTGAAGPRKANVLGAKKVPKLGAKKLTADVIDFDEAEKKAKEEAERIAKLGYDPEEETKKSTKTESSAIASPTPVSPVRGGYGSHSREKSATEVERLGMGVARLGFGQIGGGKAVAAQKKNAGGFGSVGPVKATAAGTFPQPMHLGSGRHSTNSDTDDEEKYARSKFGTQKAISSDEFFGKGSFDPNSQQEAKSRLQGFEGASAISSNAYFGRPEDEDGGEEYGDLESAAKDFVRKFGITAGDDLENLTHLLGEGAGKLQGAIRTYLAS